MTEASPLSAERLRGLSELSGLGMMALAQVRKLAAERFNGDLMVAIGYLEVSSYAVVRGRNPEEAEVSKLRDARAWAERKAADPAWAEFLPPPAPETMRP